MQKLQGRVVLASALVGMVLFGLSGSSWARTARTRVHAKLQSTTKHLHPSAKLTSTHTHAITKIHPVAMTGEAVVPGVMPGVMPEEVAATATPDDTLVATAIVAAAPVPEEGKPYRLRMSNLHTGETLDIVYRIGDTYIPEALEKLNYFLRDHNTQDVVNYSPTEFDVLHAMMSRLGKLNDMIDIVCGYRTPETNAALRRNSPQTGVAEHSQHMEGHAIDIRVPGVNTAKLRDAALSLHAGGVGYYPVSQFVHVDVGPVREWVFGTKQRRMIMARVTRSRRVHGTRSGIVSGQ
jgi:uncharacterized protein YcbK (DUF882 family)